MSALSKEELSVFKKSRIAFLFATGRRRGLDALIAEAKKLFDNQCISGHIVIPQDLSCFQPAAGIFDSKADVDQAKQIFLNAGRRALADRRSSWSQETLESRLLGYGNAGGINVFYYNVPTTTVTALWKRCNEPNYNWMALFPRRKRD